MSVESLKLDVLSKYDKMISRISKGHELIDPMPIVKEMIMIDFLEKNQVKNSYLNFISIHFKENEIFIK